MNWFRKHLNWTLVLTWVIFLPAGVLSAHLFRYSILSPTTSSGFPVMLGAVAVVSVVVIWVATIWVIRQKGRSLLHLFWLLLPLGFIAILVLKNKVRMDTPSF